MTRTPHSIGVGQTLREAARRMDEHGIRHLPVLEDGKLRGIISARDLRLAEALSEVPLDAQSVEKVMVRDPYTVHPDTPLKTVVGKMAEQKYGCVVAMEGVSVVGVLTTVDAMHLLWQRLKDVDENAHSDLRPSAVRQQIAEGHRMLRRRLLEVDALANAVLAGKEEALDPLRDQSRALYVSLCEHIELENRILAPVLRETTGFGKERERQLLEHHEEQMTQLKRSIDHLDDSSLSPDELARLIQELVAEIRVDMAHEDRDLLSPKLLKDDPINVEFSG